MLISAIAFAILIFIIFLGIPVAVATTLVGVFGFAVLNGLTFDNIWVFNWSPSINVLTGRFYETAQEYNLSVIPLFIFMGNMIARAGIARELYDVFNAFLAHRRGGLASATVMSCAGFASVCGSSLATVATMGKVSLPAMREHGYKDSIAAGSIAAGGTLGILIPPSAILIIYGILTETSIRELFAAGFIPGFLGLVGYLIAVQYFVWRNPDQCPAGKYTPWPIRLQKLKYMLPIMTLFTIVLGGIYLGIVTPTESAGIGAAGSILITILHGKFSTKIFKDVLDETILTTAVLFTIIIGALTLSTFVTRAELPDELLTLVQSFNVSPYMVIVLILCIYLIMGMLFDGLGMILLTVPIFYPLVQALGFDLVWFGIIVVVVTEISLITPPIGTNVFILTNVAKDLKVTDVFKGIVPFWFMDIIRLAILTAFPIISLWLPQSLY